MSDCRSSLKPGWLNPCPESRNGAHFCAEDTTHRCLHKCPCGVQWTDQLDDESAFDAVDDHTALPPTTGETA